VAGPDLATSGIEPWEPEPVRGPHETAGLPAQLRSEQRPPPELERPGVFGRTAHRSSHSAPKITRSGFSLSGPWGRVPRSSPSRSWVSTYWTTSGKVQTSFGGAGSLIFGSQ
jgi:hypothetical protein